MLTDAEMRRLLAVVAQGKHAARNRMAVMLSHLAGLRVGEIASLKVSDVIDRDGAVREQIRLSAAVTKCQTASKTDPRLECAPWGGQFGLRN